MMEPQSNPVDLGDLASARTGYGLGTAPWAAFRHHVEDDWWIAMSGTNHVDYNIALLHGPTAPQVASRVIDEVDAARVPALIMLAGAGLRAADTLAEAGWISTGALPFMGKMHGTAEDDPAVRLLESNELADARRLASAAFGVPEEVGAIVFTDAILGRPDCRTWGLFEGGQLKCCALNVHVQDHFCVGWALSTAPEDQRSGYGRRLLRAVSYRRQQTGPPISLLMASRAGTRLYQEPGRVIFEHWQIWSRSRWALR
jgi:GNAT superfamily N-acetyltransferase